MQGFYYILMEGASFIFASIFNYLLNDDKLPLAKRIPARTH